MRSPAQATAHPDAVMPGRTHLQHAQPILLAHHLLAHAWPLVRDLERLRDWRVRAHAVAVRGRRAGGRSARTRPGARRVRAEPRRADAELDRRDGEPGCRGRVRLHRRAARHRPVAIRRRRHPLGDPRVRLRAAGRRLLDGVVDHAAEEEPRHRRARARQGRPPGRQPHGPARRRSRACRWPTTATCRRTRSRSSTRCARSRCCFPAFTGMVATLEFDTARMAELAPQGFSLATDVADQLVRQGVPFREAHEIAGRAGAVLRGARPRARPADATPTTRRSTRA